MSEKLSSGLASPSTCQDVTLQQTQLNPTFSNALAQVGCFHAIVFLYWLRLEQAQITKQGAWQGHISYFGLKAVQYKANLTKTTVGNLKLIPQVHHRCRKHSRTNFWQNSSAVLPPVWLSISTVVCRTAAGLLEQEISKLPSQREGWMSTWAKGTDLFLA